MCERGLWDENDGSKSDEYKRLETFDGLAAGLGERLDSHLLGLARHLHCGPIVLDGHACEHKSHTRGYMRTHDLQNVLGCVGNKLVSVDIRFCVGA